MARIEKRDERRPVFLETIVGGAKKRNHTCLTPFWTHHLSPKAWDMVNLPEPFNRTKKIKSTGRYCQTADRECAAEYPETYELLLQMVKRGRMWLVVQIWQTEVFSSWSLYTVETLIHSDRNDSKLMMFAKNQVKMNTLSCSYYKWKKQASTSIQHRLYGT